MDRRKNRKVAVVDFDFVEKATWYLACFCLLLLTACFAFGGV